MKFCVPLILFIAHAALFADTVSVPVKGLPYSATSFLYSQDGAKRVTACSDGKLRVFNLNDSVSIQEIPVSDGIFSSMRFSQDYTGIILLQGDTGIYRVAYPSGSVARYKIPKNIGWVFAYSNDGFKCVLYNFHDSTKSILDLASGARQACLKGIKTHPNEMGIAFTPDNSGILVVLPDDSSAQFRLIGNDSLMHTYHLPKLANTYCAVSPDGKKFAVPLHTGSEYTPESTIVIFDIETGEAIPFDIPVKSIDSTIRTSWIANLRYSSDGTNLLVGLSAILDVETKEWFFLLRPKDCTALTMWFSPDNRSITVDKRNYDLCIDSMAMYRISTSEKTVLSAKKYWPEVVASGFSESGEDLYCGVYQYPVGNYTAKTDSIVFWNGATNREIVKKGFWDDSFVFSSFWLFSSDGRRLIENTFKWDYHVYTSIEIAVHDVSAASAPLFSMSVPKQAIVSQDKQSLFILDTASYKIVDVATGDSVASPFKLPDGWTIKAVQTETKLLCAFSTKQKSSQDSIIDWAGIWNLETGQCVNQFIVSNHPWFYKDKIMRALFLPDGQHMVVHAGEVSFWNDLVALFDVRTGAKLFNYPAGSGVFGISLTPDGKQLLVGSNNLSMNVQGIYCFDAAKGTFQRLYKTNYSPGDQGESMISFNPKNPRQFICGDKIWELPEALPVLQNQKTDFQGAFRILSASSKRISFSMPYKNVAASIKIYQPNGRKVMQAFFFPGGYSRQAIVLPNLARGVYMYRFEAAVKSLCSQGIFLIP
jgi:WD40 repeat protein